MWLAHFTLIFSLALLSEIVYTLHMISSFGFFVMQENGYQLLFLSARSISQSYITRQFLLNIKQVYPIGMFLNFEYFIAEKFSLPNKNTNYSFFIIISFLYFSCTPVNICQIIVSYIISGW